MIKADDMMREVAWLKNEGKTYVQICEALGISKSYVNLLVRAAKNNGLVKERGKSTTRHAIRAAALSRYGVQYGRIGDVMCKLSRDQFTWLCAEVEKGGYENVAEYLTELVRDEHAGSVDVDGQKG